HAPIVPWSLLNIRHRHRGSTPYSARHTRIPTGEGQDLFSERMRGPTPSAPLTEPERATDGPARSRGPGIWPVKHSSLSEWPAAPRIGRFRADCQWLAGREVQPPGAEVSGTTPSWPPGPGATRGPTRLTGRRAPCDSSST